MVWFRPVTKVYKYNHHVIDCHTPLLLLVLTKLSNLVLVILIILDQLRLCSGKQRMINDHMTRI